MSIEINGNSHINQGKFYVMFVDTKNLIYQIKNCLSHYTYLYN